MRLESNPNHERNCDIDHNRHNSRPRIQRAFLTWLAESRHRFLVPLRITRRTKRNIELEFEGGQSLISARLTPWEISVGFYWEGICWDLMICFEAIPELTSNGYECRLCDSERRVVYPNREQVWCEHLFEPFLTWVNSKLINSPWIEVYGFDGGSTSARLLDSLPETISHQSMCHQIIINPLKK